MPSGLQVAASFGRRLRFCETHRLSNGAWSGGFGRKLGSERPAVAVAVTLTLTLTGSQAGIPTAPVKVQPRASLQGGSGGDPGTPSRVPAQRCLGARGPRPRAPALRPLSPPEAAAGTHLRGPTCASLAAPRRPVPCRGFGTVLPARRWTALQGSHGHEGPASLVRLPGLLHRVQAMQWPGVHEPPIPFILPLGAGLLKPPRRSKVAEASVVTISGGFPINPS